MGRRMRRRLVGQRDYPIDPRSRQRRDPRRPSLVAGQPCDPLVHEARLPAPDHRLVLAEETGNGVGALARAAAVRLGRGTVRGLDHLSQCSVMRFVDRGVEQRPWLRVGQHHRHSSRHQLTEIAVLGSCLVKTVRRCR